MKRSRLEHNSSYELIYDNSDDMNDSTYDDAVDSYDSHDDAGANTGDGNDIQLFNSRYALTMDCLCGLCIYRMIGNRGRWNDIPYDVNTYSKVNCRDKISGLNSIVSCDKVFHVDTDRDTDRPSSEEWECFAEYCTFYRIELNSDGLLLHYWID